VDISLDDADADGTGDSFSSSSQRLAANADDDDVAPFRLRVFAAADDDGATKADTDPERPTRDATVKNNFMMKIVCVGWVVECGRKMDANREL